MERNWGFVKKEERRNGCRAANQQCSLPGAHALLKQDPFSIWFQVKTARPPGPGGLLCPPVAFSWSRLSGHTVCTRVVESSFVTRSFLVLSVAWFFWAGYVFFFYSLILSLALSPSEASRLPFKIPVLCPVSHLPRNSSSGLFLLLTLASTLKSLKTQLCLMALHPLCQIRVRSHFIFIVITQGLELSGGDNVRAETVAQACSALSSSEEAQVCLFTRQEWLHWRQASPA